MARGLRFSGLGTSHRFGLVVTVVCHVRVTADGLVRQRGLGERRENSARRQLDLDAPGRPAEGSPQASRRTIEAPCGAIGASEGTGCGERARFPGASPLFAGTVVKLSGVRCLLPRVVR